MAWTVVAEFYATTAKKKKKKSPAGSEVVRGFCHDEVVEDPNARDQKTLQSPKNPYKSFISNALVA